MTSGLDEVAPSIPSAFISSVAQAVGFLLYPASVGSPQNMRSAGSLRRARGGGGLNPTAEHLARSTQTQSKVELRVLKGQTGIRSKLKMEWVPGSEVSAERSERSGGLCGLGLICSSAQRWIF